MGTASTGRRLGVLALSGVPVLTAACTGAARSRIDAEMTTDRQCAGLAAHAPS